MHKNESIKKIIEENIHDSRKLWKELNRITRGQSDTRQFMYLNGEKICDKLTISNKYNQLTINSINQICDSIKLTPFVACSVDRMDRI